MLSLTTQCLAKDNIEIRINWSIKHGKGVDDLGAGFGVGCSGWDTEVDA
jgi:hypothetical protein